MLILQYIEAIDGPKSANQHVSLPTLHLHFEAPELHISLLKIGNIMLKDKLRDVFEALFI